MEAPSDADPWTAEEAAATVLARIQTGKIKPTALVISWIEDTGATIYHGSIVATRSAPDALYAVARTQMDILNG